MFFKIELSYKIEDRTISKSYIVKAENIVDATRKAFEVNKEISSTIELFIKAEASSMEVL